MVSAGFCFAFYTSLRRSVDGLSGAAVQIIAGGRFTLEAEDPLAKVGDALKQLNDELEEARQLKKRVEDGDLTVRCVPAVGPLGNLADVFNFLLDSLSKPIKKPLVTLSKPDVPTSFIPHVFQLREDLTITLALPGDLSSKDVERLNRWMVTLPIDVAG